MPLLILLIGVVLLITAARGTTEELGDLFVEQFAGPQSFTAWALAFIMLSILGNVEALKPLARALMGLLMLVLVLTVSRSTNLLEALRVQVLGKTVSTKDVAK